MSQEKSADSAIPSEWQPIVSGNAELEVSSVPVGSLPALRVDFDFKGGRGSEGKCIERNAGFPSARRVAGLRLEAPAGRCAAMDRDRFDRAPYGRRFDRRMARPGAGERLSCPKLEQRHSLEDRVHRKEGGRQTELRVSTRAQDPISSPGAR